MKGGNGFAVRQRREGEGKRQDDMEKDKMGERKERRKSTEKVEKERIGKERGKDGTAIDKKRQEW